MEPNCTLRVLPTISVAFCVIEFCFDTSSIDTCNVFDDGGFLDSKWHPINVDARSIATVTKCLIFTKAISSIMARSLIRQVGNASTRHTAAYPAG